MSLIPKHTFGKHTVSKELLFSQNLKISNQFLHVWTMSSLLTYLTMHILCCAFESFVLRLRNWFSLRLRNWFWSSIILQSSTICIYMSVQNTTTTDLKATASLFVVDEYGPHIWPNSKLATYWPTKPPIFSKLCKMQERNCRYTTCRMVYLPYNP